MINKLNKDFEKFVHRVEEYVRVVSRLVLISSLTCLVGHLDSAKEIWSLIFLIENLALRVFRIGRVFSFRYVFPFIGSAY